MRAFLCLLFFGLFVLHATCSQTAYSQSDLLTGPVNQPLQIGEVPTYPSTTAAPFQVPTRQTAAASSLLVAEPSHSSLVFKQAQATIDHFGSAGASRTLQSLPGRPSFMLSSAGGAASQPATKPFSGASNGPTVSPYMNLFRDVDEQSAPNYFAFVRPQLQQQRLNREQQTEIQTLNRELQRFGKGSQGNGNAGGVPVTGHGTRFLNTSQYYSGFDR